MSFTSRSLRSDAEHSYDSVLWFDAESAAGVRYAIARLTFGRRLDLARRIREIGRRAEFLAAGTDAREKLELGARERSVDDTGVVVIDEGVYHAVAVEEYGFHDFETADALATGLTPEILRFA